MDTMQKENCGTETITYFLDLLKVAWAGYVEQDGYVKQELACCPSTALSTSIGKLVSGLFSLFPQ